MAQRSRRRPRRYGRRVVDPDLPDGLELRVDRFRFDDLCLRAWRMSLAESAGGPGPQEPPRNLVLLHGLGVSSAYYGRVAVALARVGTVHLLDLPGFAAVPPPRDAAGIEEFAGLVDRWLRRQRLANVVLVGHSMGSQIVTEVLARDPGVATHGVLIGPPVNAQERSVGQQMVRLAQSSVRESRGTRAMALAGYRRTTVRWFRQVLPGMLRFPVEQRIADVDTPLLVVRGEYDRVAPREWTAMLTERAPDAWSAEIPGASHAVIYEHGREVAALIAEHAARPARGKRTEQAPDGEAPASADAHVAQGEPHAPGARDAQDSSARDSSAQDSDARDSGDAARVPHGSDA